MGGYAHKYTHIKILHILKIMERTDASHPITTTKVVEKLALQGIKTERKSVLRDLHCLEEAGYVARCENHTKGFYMSAPTFRDYEFKILADAVGTARFLAPEDRRTLLQKLRGQASAEVQPLLPEVSWYDMAHTVGDAEYITKLQIIMQAISLQKTLEFQYYEQSVGDVKKLKWDGYRYHVDPYYLLPIDGEYFLLGASVNHSTMQHYRIQRITSLQITEQRRRPLQQIQGFAHGNQAVQQHLQNTFHNWGPGELHPVRLRFEKYCLPAVQLAFGQEAMIREQEDGKFSATVSAPDTHGFYAWLASFGDGISLEFPAEMQQKLVAFLQRTLAQYGK